MSPRKSKSPQPAAADEAAETAPAADPVPDEAPAQETQHAATEAAADASTADSPIDADADAPAQAVAQGTPVEPDTEAATGGDDAGEERPREEIKRAIEALIFVADKAVTAQQLARIVKLKLADARVLIGELMHEYSDRGIELSEIGGGYLFRSAPACADYVRSLASQRPVRLTRAQLETLALVAYRQPITRPEVDEVRGVDTGSAVRVLLERGLIKMLGRKDEPGRPLLYGTSPYFLEFFGMNSLKDLPTLREFTELSDEHRELFQRKTGEAVEDVEAELAALAAEAEAEAEAEAQLGEEDLGEDDEDVQASADQPAADDAAIASTEPHEDADDDDDDDEEQDRDADGDRDAAPDELEERTAPIDP